MVRAFIAVPVGDAAKSAVVEVMDTLRASGARQKDAAVRSAWKAVRWVSRDGIHLTLKFLGDIDEHDVLRAQGALDALKDMRAFRIDLCGIGAFPSVTGPRVLWIGVRQADQVRALAGRIEGTIGDINRENRSFSAHITVARLSDPAGVVPAGRAGPLEKVREMWDDQIIGTSPVDRAVLFQSILGPKGAVYLPLYEVALKKEAV